MRIIDMFDRVASFHPHKDCLIDLSSGGRHSYEETSRASHLIANGLQALGVVPGVTKVAVYSPNTALAVMSVLGVFRSGAVHAPINSLGSVADNAYVVDLFDTEVLLYHPDFEEAVRTFRETCPKVRAFVRMTLEPVDGPSLGDWLRAPFRPANEFPEDRNMPMVILGSGGTTGRPKGVVHSQGVWETIAVTWQLALPVRKPPVHLVVAPITHAAGAILFSLFMVGATHLIMRKFSAKDVLDAMEAHGVTHLFVPPTALYAMLAEPDVRKRDYSRLDYLIYGSAPSSSEKVQEAVSVFGPVLAQGYGLTEAAPAGGTILTPQDHADAVAHGTGRLASCGRLTPLARMKIVDDDGQPVKPGERGVIAFGGEFQMLEYYKNPAQTAEVRKDGWVLTGDVGYLDEEGYLYIVDRKREMIISGGFNVFPGEVEQAVFQHPAVQDCAVVGVPDEKWGEAVKAVVQLKPGASATEAEIIELCKKRLGSVMAPKSVEFWDDLPRSPVGKVMRRAVRDRYWTGKRSAIV